MKVKLSPDKYNNIELTVKKRKKIIIISSLIKDEINLQSDYLASGDIEYEPSSSYTESGINVIWAQNKHYLVDFRKEIDKEKSNTVVDGNSINICRKWDTKLFKLKLIAYHITKEE